MCYSPLLLMFYSSLLLSFEQVKVYRDYSVGDQTGGDVMAVPLMGPLGIWGLKIDPRHPVACGLCTG